MSIPEGDPLLTFDLRKQRVEASGREAIKEVRLLAILVVGAAVFLTTIGALVVLA